MTSRFRVGAAAIGAAGALLVGAMWDPACAVATTLPTGTIEANSVNYEAYVNDAQPADSSSPGFGIDDVSEDDGPLPDAFDGAFHLTLNAKPFKDSNNSVDISPDTANLGATGMLLTASGKTAGLSVTAKIGMFGTSERARLLYRIKNPSTRARTVTSTYTTNFGSDDDTVVELTSDGDTTTEPSDSWVVSSADGSIDDDNIADPAVTTAWGDAAGETLIFESFELGLEADVFQVKHTFRIRPGKTAQLLFFHQFEEAVAVAETESDPEFDTLTTLNAAGLLNGLSGNFVNWVPLP